jgi:hypothetical protein
MPARQPRTESKLAALDAKVEERHVENKQWQKDTDLKLDAMNAKLDALMARDAMMKGIWKAVSVTAIAVYSVGTVISHLIEWLKGH